MALRLAAAGEIAGMTEADTLGIATALSSVGVEAEMGGTAFSRIMQMMHQATFANVEQLGVYEQTLDMSAKQQEAFAKSLGLSVREFKEQRKQVLESGGSLVEFGKISGMSAEASAKAFKEKPAEAITAFVQGLAKMHNSGQDVYTTLANLGIEERRMTDALLRAATAGDLLTDSVKLSNKAWAENTALTDEAQKRYETTAARLKVLWNNITNLAIVIGDTLLPTLIRFSETLTPMAEKLANFAEEHPRLTTYVIGTAAALGSLSLAVSGVSFMFSGLLNLFQVFIGIKAWMGFTATATAVTQVGTAATAAVPALAGLSVAGVASFAAIGAAVLAVVAGVAAIGYSSWKLIEATNQMRASGEALDATIQRRIEQLRAQGIAVDELLLKEMNRDQQIAYLHELELGRNDIALQMYLEYLAGKDQADELFQQAKNFRLNTEITNEEAARLALLNIDAATKIALMQADAAHTQAMLEQLGIRTGAAKRSGEELTATERQTSQAVSQGIAQRTYLTEAETDAIWNSADAYFGFGDAARQSSRLATESWRSGTSNMQSFNQNLGGSYQQLFEQTMPNSAQAGFQETYRLFQEFVASMKEESAELQEAIQGSVDTNMRHSPSINDYARIGFADTLGIMRNFVAQGAPIAMQFRQMLTPMGGVRDLSGPIFGGVSTPEQRVGFLQQAAQSAAVSASTVNNVSNSSTSNGPVSIKVDVHTGPISSNVDMKRFAIEIGRELRKATEDTMAGRFGLAPRCR